MPSQVIASAINRPLLLSSRCLPFFFAILAKRLLNSDYVALAQTLTYYFIPRLSVADLEGLTAFTASHSKSEATALTLAARDATLGQCVGKPADQLCLGLED